MPQADAGERNQAGHPMTPTHPMPAAPHGGAVALRLVQSQHLVLWLAVAYFVALLPFTPGLAHPGNLREILRTLLPLFIVATGQTVVLITGGIDLSVGSIMALASVLGALTMSGDTGWLAGSSLATPVGVLVMLLTGAFAGLLNGLAVTWFRMPPFMVTLAAMMFHSGLAIWITKSRTIYNLPGAFNALGGHLGLASLTAVAVGGFAHLLLSRSLGGRWLYAVGQNARTARVSGVPVGAVTIAAYVLSGGAAALAAVLYTGQAETGSPVLGQRLLLDIIAGTVIGGTSLFGGRGTVPGTLVGVLFIKLLDNSLNLLNLSLFAITMVKGGVILLAALVDATRVRLQADSTSADETSALLRTPGPPDADGTSALPSPASGLLQFVEVSRSFGSARVLKAVSFGFPPAKTVGLVGENGAGKSTLMNILGGNLQPDRGHMLLDGHGYAPSSPSDAARRGLGFVHQELNLFPNLTIAENLFLTRFPRLGGWPIVDRTALQDQTRARLRDVGLDLAPETPVERLGPGERQLVEIARALSFDARLIILDEPTTSLSTRETERLFGLLGALRARGIAMIYISHQLGDVLRLCDDIVVLRDGEVVGQGPGSAFNADRLITLMVGRSLNQLFPQRTTPGTRGPSPSHEPSPRSRRREEADSSLSASSRRRLRFMAGEQVRKEQGATPEASPQATQPLLEIRNLTQPGLVKNVNLTLHAGEVLGLSGLLGAGRTELARLLFGLEPCERGEVRLRGQSLATASVRERIRGGLAFLTEDRRADGLCLGGAIADNIALVSLPRHASRHLGLLKLRSLREAVSRIRQAVRLTSTAADGAPVKTLSGGNQQKVVLARWLLAKPAVLILDEPTRGIDVGARYEIYQLLLERADQGTGVLLISSELEELTGLCDRILVMRRGEIVDEVTRPDFDRERLLRGALGT